MCMYAELYAIMCICMDACTVSCKLIQNELCTEWLHAHT